MKKTIIAMGLASLLLSVTPTMLYAESEGDESTQSEDFAPAEDNSSVESQPSESSSANHFPESTPQVEARSPARQLEGSLHYLSGYQTIGNNLVNLDLPKDYVFIGADDARKVIVDLWGNPPDTAKDVLGMILPSKGHLDDEDSWGAVLSYSADGHVKDDDAYKINYDKLLSDMKEASAANNKEREANGYEGMDLVGWAVQPRYDGAHHVLHWAKEYEPKDHSHLLNYDVRFLGRDGILSLVVVSNMAQLPKLQQAINDLPMVASFTKGHKYEDFNEDTDKVSEYGLAALVAGGTVAAAAKAGKLAFLAILLKKGWVVILAAIVGLKRFAGKLFGQKAA